MKSIHSICKMYLEMYLLHCRCLSSFLKYVKLAFHYALNYLLYVINGVLYSTCFPINIIIYILLAAMSLLVVSTIDCCRHRH